MARIRSSHLRLTVVVAPAALAATGCGSSSSSGTSSAASTTAPSTAPSDTTTVGTTSASGQAQQVAAILKKETNQAIKFNKDSDFIVSLHCAVVKKNLSWRCNGTSTNHEKFRWAKVTFDPKSGRMSTPPPTLVK